MDTSSLLKRMQDEWSTLNGGREAEGALPRWKAAEPLLYGAADLQALITRCHRRGDTADSNAALAALLRLAGDEPLAARAVLQALLPGLMSLSRHGRRVGWSRRAGTSWGERPTPWAQAGDFDQELLTLAWERVQAAAGQDLQWPAAMILGQVWRRVRMRLDDHRRRTDRQVALVADEVDRLHSDPGVNWEQQSAWLLRDAVLDGTLADRDGALIFITRVLGVSTADAAAQLGVSVGAVLARRRRAERALAPTLVSAA